MLTESADKQTESHPVTPDGRYFIVRGRLWRMSNPTLSDEQRQRLVYALMQARRAVGAARRSDNGTAESAAHAYVDTAKHALGEGGPVWCNDGTLDYNRRFMENTPYAGWFAGLC